MASMEAEQWRPVEGYEDKYEVSDFGRVRNMIKGFILKQTKHSDGYLMVSLNNTDGQNKPYIHRLVARAFIPNPDNLPTVDHIDRDKTNNAVYNLRWASRKQQVANIPAKGYTIRHYKGNVSIYAQIQINGKSIAIKCETEDEARQTYITLHKQEHGEFSPYE